MVITLCGSTRFKKEFKEIQEYYTLLGHIVLAPVFYSHSSKRDEKKVKGYEDVLMKVAKEKIVISDIVFIIIIDDRAGKNTVEEYKFAKDIGKRIHILDRSWKECPIKLNVK